MSVAPGLDAQGRGGRRKLDQRLRERVEQGAGDATEKVIITLKPGARVRAAGKLQARRGRLSRDFAMLGAVAADVPTSELEALANDDDVLSVSADADVYSDGVATAVTGSAAGSGYSLRSTLGLVQPSSTATTRTFQQGDASAYAGAVDAQIESYYPTTSFGTSKTMEVDNDSDPSDGYDWTLIRFDNLFGSGANQIPVGSTITSATLTVKHLADGNAGASASVRRMLVDWAATSTWNSLSVSGAGLQFDSVEASASADATVTNLAATGSKAFSGANMTATVQAWANGESNRGWMIWQDQNNGWIMKSSEATTLANRPMLSVTYKAPVETSTRTGTGITIAVIDSGMVLDGGGTTRIKTTRDFTTGLSNPAAISPVDGYGHGTHVASLAGNDKAEAKGVAPGVSYVSLKVLNSWGVGST